MRDDPIVAAIRAMRNEYTAQHGYDVKADICDPQGSAKGIRATLRPLSLPPGLAAAAPTPKRHRVAITMREQ